MIDGATGLVALTSRFRGTVSQDFQLQDFPFDVQRIDLVRSCVCAGAGASACVRVHVCVACVGRGRGLAFVSWRPALTTV